jgi:hypothetical protein
MADRPKLGSLFSAPATERPAALAGILESVPATVIDAEPQPTAEQTEPARTSPPQSRVRRPSEARTRRPAASQPPPTNLGNQVVPVVLDASVLTELRAFTARTEQTHGTVALRAIEANADELASNWKHVRPAAAPGRLFGTTATAHRRTEPGVQTQLRISSADAATLDNLVAEWAAPSRSALVNEALRRYIFAKDESRSAV